jgi:molecular chaperone DnaK
MKKAIGIDLGTTNTVVAFKDTAVRIIRNKENEELTRSCVGLRKSEILVGRNAYQLLTADPINTILSIKRLMGGAIKDKMVVDMKNSPYYKYGITSLQGGTDDAVAVLLGGKQYTPEQISAEILKKVKRDAEEKLGDEITHAVITVPAYFTEKQRNATRVAAQLAGLKVQRLLSEPTAAAIAYGVDNLNAGDAIKVLVYDFGGGTTDLSILTIVDGNIIEEGTGGDRWLGGDDIDRKLTELILIKVSEQYKISNLPELIEQLPDRKRFQLEGQIRFQTEEAKKQLSSSQTAMVFIDNILEDENGDMIDIDVTVSREELEFISRPYIEKSIDLIENLLSEVRYDSTLIDSILLVGGSSCIPLVKEMLSEKFGSEKIKDTKETMLVVSKGAAILAHRLGDEYEPPIDGTIPDIDEITHTTNHDYFIQLRDDENNYRLEKIIQKQTPKPVEKTRIFKTTVNNQKVVKVSLWTDIENGEHQEETTGFFTIEEDLPKGSEIVFNISLDLDEVFEVKVHPKSIKAKERKIVLGRGNKDTKALKFISEYFDKVLKNEFSERGREYFFDKAKQEIEKINCIGTESSDSYKWAEIGTAVFTAFEQAEKMKEGEVDEESLAVVFATILINEYPDLIGNESTDVITQLLREIRNENDPLQNMQANQELKAITGRYPALITLFTVKMAADDAAKTNPEDAHRLLEVHDQIVTLFRSKRKDDAFALLDEALRLRDKYTKGGIDVESIHLK